MANDCSPASRLQSAGEGVPPNGDPLGNTTNLCTAPTRLKIPIVFVPGVMGSRLDFTTIRQQWDPDSELSMSHWLTTADLEQVRNELRHTTPVEIMGAQHGLNEDEVTHGYGGVSMDFYVPFLRYLRAQQFNLNVDTPVWAIGYDWRQSNKVSGVYVTGKVNYILGVEKASQVILISHSMGGLVTRSAMKEGLAGKVLGVVHITQPVDGSVAMYRRFFTGATGEFDSGGWAFNTILGNTGLRFAMSTSGMPGPIQLLPTNKYKDIGNKDWITYRENGVISSWSGNVYDLYVGSRNPPAIPPPDMSAPALADLITHVRLAKSFHAELGRYKHSNTKNTYSTGLRTDMAILFDPPTQPAPVTTRILGTFDWTTTPDWQNRGAQQIARAEGDGTVPSTSANPLKPTFEVNGVEHSAACNDGSTRDQISKWIIEFLS